MHVHELYELTLWIDKYVKDGEIVQRYSALHSTLQHNAQNPQQQPFEQQQSQLLEALRSLPTSALSEAQLAWLACFGIAEHIGEEAATAVEDVLFRNALDVASAASKVQLAAQAVAAGIKRSDAVNSAMGGCIDDSPPSQSPDEVLLRVTFAGKASIANVVDLKHWSDTWHQIARGITMAFDGRPEDVRVVEAGRGSVVLTLGVSMLFAKGVQRVLLESMKVAESYLDLRLKAEDLRGSRLRNDKLSAELARQLEEEARKERDEAADSIADRLLEEMSTSKKKRGDKNAPLRKAVDHLLEFLSSGGSVDPVFPVERAAIDGEDPDPQFAELRAVAQEIRLLSSRLALLGPGPGSDEGEGDDGRA